MIALLAFAVAGVAALRGAWSPCGLSVLSSLNPVSERVRGHRFSVTAAWYVVGAVLGGALLGVACAVPAGVVALIGVPGGWRWALVLAGALVAVVSDARVTRWALPEHPRQVDERWLTSYRRWLYAGGFGVQIGTGFATYIMSAAVYLTALLAVLSGSVGTAIEVGTVFGTVRGLTLLSVARATTPQRLRSMLARIDALGEVSLLTATVTSAVVGIVAAARLAGPVAAVAVGVGLGVVVGARRGSRHGEADQPRDHQRDVEHPGHLLDHHQRPGVRIDR